MAWTDYPWLEGDELSAGEKVTENITAAQGYVGSALARIASLDADWIFDDDIPELVMPSVNWNEISSGDVIQFFNDAYNQFVYPPINTTIEVDDIPDLEEIEVPTTYDDEPLTTMRDKIKTDIDASSYGPETADRTGLDARSTERAGIASVALLNGTLGLLMNCGMVFPTTARVALENEAARNVRSAASEAGRSNAIAYSDAWTAGKKMTREIGLEVNRWLFQEFALKVEMVVAVFNAKIEGYAKRLEAKTTLVGYEYDHYIARIKAYTALVGAMEQVIQLAEKNLDTTMDVFRNRIEIAVSQVKGNIQKLMGIAEVHVGAEKAIFDANRAVATGALSVMNVSAAVSSAVHGSNNNEASASEQRSSSTNDTFSVTERHNYSSE